MKKNITALILLTLTALTVSSAQARILNATEEIRLQPATGSNIFMESSLLTASRPLKLGASKDLVSAFIDLGTEVTGSLPASSVSSTPAGNLVATDIQAAVNELDSEKVAKAGDTMTGALGIGGAPDAVAQLDVQSTTKGILPPRMTEAQRDAIAAVESLIVYNTDTSMLNIYDGVVWGEIGGGVDIGASTDNAIARWDGAAGDTIQNSTVIVADDGDISGVDALSANSIAVTGNIDSALTQDSVVFAGASGVLSEDNTNFTWDNATKILQIIGEFIADNLSLNGNTVSATNVNGDVVLEPDGIGEVVAQSPVIFQQIATVQTATAGYNTIAAKTDGYFYKKDSSGNEVRIDERKDLATYYANDFETDTSSTWTTGNNATFLTAGTLDGVLADETGSPIHGTRSFEYTAGAASTNDWVASPEITLQNQPGRVNYIAFDYTWTGTADVRVKVKCTAGDTSDFLGTSDVVITSTSRSRFTASFGVSGACTGFKYGFHFVNAPANGNILRWDDVELSVAPPINLAKTDVQSLRFKGNTFQNDADEWRFPAALDSSDFIGRPILIVEDDAGNTRTKFTALRKARVSGSWNPRLDTSTGRSQVYVNGTLIQDGSTMSSATGWSSVSFSVELDAGDYLSFGSPVGEDTGQDSNLVLVAEAESQAVISAEKSNALDMQDYVPTVVGFGTPTSTKYQYAQIGEFIYISAKFTSGTSTATEAQFGLPSGMTVSSKLTTVSAVGFGARNAGAGHISVLATAGDAFLNFGSAGSNMLVPQDGSTISSVGEIVSFSVLVPIEGLSFKNQVLAHIPTERHAIFSYQQPSATSGGSGTADAWTKYPLNTTVQSAYFASIASNVITLQKGVYKAECKSQHHDTDEVRVRLRNTTAGATVGAVGRAFFDDATDVAGYVHCDTGYFTLNTQANFEMQYYADLCASATCLGFQSVSADGEANTYGTLTIEKIKDVE